MAQEYKQDWKLNDTVLPADMNRIEGNIKTIEDLVSLEPTAKTATLPAGNTNVTNIVKSPVNVKRIDGKTIVNHIPLFDSGAWVFNSTVNHIAPNEVTVTTTAGTSWQSNHIFIPVESGKTYTLKATIVGGSSRRLLIYKGQVTSGASLFSFMEIAEVTQSFTIDETFNGYITVQLTASTGGGGIHVKDLSLVEGIQSKPFVANVKGLTNPTIVNETNGTSLVVPTTLYDGEYVEQSEKGELVKYKKWQEKVLDGSAAWEFSLNGNGNKRVHLKIANKDEIIPDASAKTIVKYNGSLLEIIDIDRADTGFTLTGNGYLYLRISNTDSGWGPDYTPTPEEIKAYFLGWKMYDYAAGWEAEQPYNTGAKYWAYRGTNGKLAGGVNTLPTTQAPINSKWQPYRLIYELATPVQEIIQPYSDLTLENGTNSVKVYAGRIVNESAQTPVSGGVAFIAYNDPGVSGGLNVSKFKYAPGKILKINRNGQVDIQWTIFKNEEPHNPLYFQGNERGIISQTLHDPTASYTVDYEPLYTWEVTAPIDSVQLQYFETLQAVTNELVHDVAKQQDTVKRMLENVVNEGYNELKWISIGVQNITKGYIEIAKDKYGCVHIKFMLQSGTWNQGAILNFLPKGYIPYSSLAVPASFNNLHPFGGDFAIFINNNDGGIRMGYNLRQITQGQTITDANISGYFMFRPKP